MNKFQPHVFVIPEDQAEAEIANGFTLHDRVDARRIQVMPPARGWSHVLSTFKEEYIPRLRNYSSSRVVMLIDFDGWGEDRMAECRKSIPEDLKDRVFVVGPSGEPEKLKAALKLSLERIGRQLADECDREDDDFWTHEQLRHNREERERMARDVRPFLFRPE